MDELRASFRHLLGLLNSVRDDLIELFSHFYWSDMAHVRAEDLRSAALFAA